MRIAILGSGAAGSVFASYLKKGGVEDIVLVDLYKAHLDKIAAGDLPHISLETLMKIQTPVWAEQHKALGID